VLLYGFAVGHWSWETKTKQVKTYVRDQESNKIKVHKDTVDINQPCFKNMDLRRVLVDPATATQDVRKSAGYVILQLSIDADQLDDLRDDPAYKNVPTRDELREILTLNPHATHDSLIGNKTNSWRDLQKEQDFVVTSADPLAQPLEILEYWTDDRTITVLNRCIVIRNDENEWARKTQVSCAFIDVLNSFWGFGIAKLIGSDQRFSSAIRNMWVDAQSLVMNPMFQQPKGAGTGTQQIVAEPGRVVTTTGELKPLTPPSISMEASNSIEFSDNHANRVAGSNGGANMPSQAMRTGAGVNAFTADVTQRLEYFLEIFSEAVFAPILEAYLEMCCDKLEPQQINDILTASQGQAWKGDILDVYNATASIQLNCTGKFSARAAAAQLVPQLIALLNNAAVQSSLQVQGMKFNYEELISESLSLMNWNPDTLIIPMTPQDEQRAAAQNPAVVKGQMDQQLAAQQQQNTLAQIEEKGYVQAGVAAMRQAFKEHGDEASQALESNFGQGTAASGQPTPGQ
jgi:hypothetical protein